MNSTYEHRNDVALHLTEKAGVLRRCRYCSTSYLRTDEDESVAYRYAAICYEEMGKQRRLFRDLRDLREVIKSVLEEHAASDCVGCDLKFA